MSSPSRDASFPTTSIGRSAGSKLSTTDSNQPRSLSRESSRESLAHPLLSQSSTGTAQVSPSTSSPLPNTSSATTWDNGLSSNNLGYVPYTRTTRTRPAPSSPTYPTPHVSHSSSTPSPSVIVTPATTSSTSSSATHVDLTTKLQLMSLKAASQALGIDTGTVGWAVLEALVGEHGIEWDSIWEALSIGKAVLMLPSESLATLKGKLAFTGSNTPVISPAFIKNHIAYMESDGTASGRVVSLSGLRGICSEENGQMSIKFTSTLHPHTQCFRDISTPGTRVRGFASLMPLAAASSDYTTYTLPTKISALSLPPRGTLSFPPPLPPRRHQQSESGLDRPSTPTSDGRGGSSNAPSRFAGLASLFGRSTSYPNSSSSATNAYPSSPAGSRPASISDNEEANADKDSTEHKVVASSPLSSSISVPACVVSASIIEQEVLEGMWKGVVGDVEKILKYSSSSSPDGTSAMIFPPILPNILVSFLESANALPVLRVVAQHPRLPSKSKVITRRLISGSGSNSAHRESSRERRDGKEASEADHHLGHETSSSSHLSHADSEHFVYEVNPYGVKEGWGSAVGSESSTGVVDRNEAEIGALEAIEELSARWQAVYREVEEVITEWAETEVMRNSQNETSETGKEGEAANGIEQRKKDILDRAEKVLCCAGGVYERLLPAPSPCTTWTTAGNLTIPITDMDDTGQPDIAKPAEIITDSAHDDALASRIAALLMVDFGLHDLDVDVSNEGDDEEKLKRKEEVMSTLRACGSELCTIEKLYTPREKAEVMVRAHRVLVDGLTELPFKVSLRDPRPELSHQSQPQSPEQENSDRETGEDELRTAVPWKKDSTFPQPQPQDDDDDDEIRPKEQEAPTKESLKEGVLDQPELVEEAAKAVSSPVSETTKDAKLEKPSSQSSALSLDILFPLLILSVVISNPPRLISNLLFTQRFLFTHNIQFSSGIGSSVTGEQAYCLVNLMAVAEFIGSLDIEGVVRTRTVQGTQVFAEDGSMPIPVPMSLPITIGSRPGSRRASTSSQHSASQKDGSGPTTPVLSSSFTLRNRVEQQASALSSSANKVLTGMSGVMDSSIGGFGVLFKSMNVNLSLPGSLPGGFGFGGEELPGLVTPALGSAQAAAPWNQNHPQNSNNADANPRDTIERKESGFSIKGLKLPIPSIPNIPTIPNLTRSTTPGPGDEKEKEMVSVSRPGSVRSMRSRRSDVSSLFGGESTEEDESEDVDRNEDESEDVSEDEEGGDEDSLRDDGDSDVSDSRPAISSDARSIKSFESMMSDGKRQARAKAVSKTSAASKQKLKQDQTRSTPLDAVAGAAGAARKSLSDRLAKVSSGIGGSSSRKTRASSPPSRRSSLLATGSGPAFPSSSRPQSPAGEHGMHAPLPSLSTSLSALPPPNARFLNCTSAEDLRLGEVKELLREYQSLVQIVKAAGGFSVTNEDPLSSLAQ